MKICTARKVHAGFLKGPVELMAGRMELGRDKPAAGPQEGAEDEEKQCRLGNYSLVLLLLKTLEHGKLAKFLVDTALDRLSQVGAALQRR